MKNHKKSKNADHTSKHRSTQLWPTLAAVGGACTLAAMPAAALELGEIQINSALGQPLRASIAYALAPNEQVSNYCIYLRPAGGGSDIPMISQAQILVTDSNIVLTGNTPIREPMVSLQVAVDCPYTPHLLREYMLMIDPATSSDSIRTAPAVVQQTARIEQESVPASTQIARQSSTPRRVVTSVSDETPISADQTYRVQAGDTASTIVARIQDRKIAIWPAVNALFEANPGAFINNDVNRLMTGAVLVIPDVVGGTAISAETVTPVQETVSTPATISTTIPGMAEVNEPVPNEAAPAELIGLPPGEPLTELAPATDTAEIFVDSASGTIDATLSDEAVTEQLRPGDIVLTPTQTGDSDTFITNTIIEDDTATRVSTDNTSSEGATPGAWTWLIWLGGAGIALILGLLLFGRVIRERFDSSPDDSEIAGRRADDDPTQKTRVIEDVDFEFEDTINSRAISLDADLTAGTGLHEVPSIDVEEDIDLASFDTGSMEIDVDLSGGESGDDEDTSTDIIPPTHRIDESSILEQEDIVEIDAENYDLSMVIDATKQPLEDYETTAKDLQAVQVDTDINEASDAHDEYTLNREVDYQVLEQDYEDELTATQAMSAEVQKAAEELALRMQQSEDVDITAEMPTEDKTREMPAAADPIILPEVIDPNNTAELRANLPASLEAENDAEASDMSAATTIEMSAAGSDITVEMHVESGSVDTKKRR